jgi:hypothetical protein
MTLFIRGTEKEQKNTRDTHVDSLIYNFDKANGLIIDLTATMVLRSASTVPFRHEEKSFYKIFMETLRRAITGRCTL